VPRPGFVVRPAQPGDARAMAELMAVVAQERTGIATEPPLDIGQRAAFFERNAASAVVAVAVAPAQIIGILQIEAGGHGFGEFGMLVEAGWRGRGVGSALVRAAIDWAREHGLHKLCLEVFAHNTAAIGLYSKLGFVEEGRRPRQYRRANGELWDTILMGLPL
jgi:RimJ/RimL family protein N-acetyltransferase